MKSLITNANSLTLDKISPTVPHMNLTSWFQTITFTLVKKTTVNFEVVETQTQIVFQGIVETVDPSKLTVLPVGERRWNQMSVWTTIDLELNNDDMFYYMGTPYRVMKKYDWAPYGYFQYECSEDFKK
jgi:hypothetical protein